MVFMVRTMKENARYEEFRRIRVLSGQGDPLEQEEASESLYRLISGQPMSSRDEIAKAVIRSRGYMPAEPDIEKRRSKACEH